LNHFGQELFVWSVEFFQYGTHRLVRLGLRGAEADVASPGNGQKQIPCVNNTKEME
jgi:hypothetical protein